MTARPGRRLLVAAPGRSSAAFTVIEWSMLLGVSLIWGSSYLWIAIGLDHFEPGLLAWMRVALGAAVLATVPAARQPVAAGDWGRVVVIAVCGNAAPALLFALAEQTLDSAVAGMVTAAVPVPVLVIGVGLTRTLPGRLQLAGLALGFGGVFLMSAPNLWGADAARLGVVYVIVAVIGYAISNTTVVPLQQRYGGVAIIARALLVSSLLLAPFGIHGLDGSSFGWTSLFAVVFLGVVGTGAVRAMNANLLGRVGAARAGVVSYLVPVVAVVLGISVRDESIGTLELAGLAVVLASSFLVTRRPAPDHSF